jgi:hypothetical protein
LSNTLGFNEHDEREHTEAFLIGMDRLDRLLLSEKVPVPGRPIHALRRIAMARGVALILGGPERSPTADAVSRWYDEQYGDRLKVDPSPGRAVILVRCDPLVIRLPLIIGQWDGIADVTKLLPGLTQPMFASLSEGEMQDIVAALPWMQQRFAAIETLPSAIRANLETAIMQMTSQSPHFGESRWGSLQFAEKTLKHFLRSKKRTPSNTHDLAALLRRCEAAELPRGMQIILSMIQCDAGVRYAEDSTLDDALAAHHASIDLAAHVAQHLVAGAGTGPVVEECDLTDLVLSASFGIEGSHGGNLLFTLAMGNGSLRRLLFSGQHCDWLRIQLRGSIGRGRHRDERPTFESGRDIRNAPPRHPLRLLNAHMPPFSFEDYAATDIIQVEAIRAYDDDAHVVLEIDAVGDRFTRLIVWSELVAPLVEMLENGLVDGRTRGLFAHSDPANGDQVAPSNNRD